MPKYRVTRGRTDANGKRWGTGTNYEAETAADAVAQDEAAHKPISSDPFIGMLGTIKPAPIIVVHLLTEVDPSEWR